MGGVTLRRNCPGEACTAARMGMRAAEGSHHCFGVPALADIGGKGRDGSGIVVVIIIILIRLLYH